MNQDLLGPIPGFPNYLIQQPFPTLWEPVIAGKQDFRLDCIGPELQDSERLNAFRYSIAQALTAHRLLGQIHGFQIQPQRLIPLSQDIQTNYIHRISVARASVLQAGVENTIDYTHYDAENGSVEAAIRSPRQMLSPEVLQTLTEKTGHLALGGWRELLWNTLTDSAGYFRAILTAQLAAKK